MPTAWDRVAMSRDWRGTLANGNLNNYVRVRTCLPVELASVPNRSQRWDCGPDGRIGGTGKC